MHVLVLVNINLQK